ncbi:MAG: cytochrome c oxidase assembly protein [Pseudomonadota bacterium]
MSKQTERRDLDDRPRPAANNNLVAALVVLTVAMFGFGYALVPLYDVFCEITGLGGKTGRLSAEVAEQTVADVNRTVTVEFITNVNAALPWHFRPKVAKVNVNPGKETLVYFEAVNNEAYEIVGHAVPSVAPNSMAKYLNKTECFCFTQQVLAAGETKDMPVRFVVDPKLPNHIRTLTLAYTFFEAQENASAAEKEKNKVGSPKS